MIEKRLDRMLLITVEAWGNTLGNAQSLSPVKAWVTVKVERSKLATQNKLQIFSCTLGVPVW